MKMKMKEAMVLLEKEKSGQQRLSRKHMWRISVSRSESGRWSRRWR